MICSDYNNDQFMCSQMLHIGCEIESAQFVFFIMPVFFLDM